MPNRSDLVRRVHELAELEELAAHRPVLLDVVRELELADGEELAARLEGLELLAAVVRRLDGIDRSLERLELAELPHPSLSAVAELAASAAAASSKLGASSSSENDGSGKLQIVGAPIGGVVRVGELAYPVTRPGPLEVKVSPGEHVIALEALGFKPTTQRATVAAGEFASVSISLELAEKDG